MGSKKKEAKEKPLEKMTAKELRDVAKDIAEITGAHGMNKEELVSNIKKARGIEDKTTGKGNSSVRDIKKKIKALKADRSKALEADDKKLAGIYRKRIIRLKKKTRRVA
ncbi:MAG: Rho termination factor N-terminal domain-containing protein [Deltaproteobacteria bacterium]|nr:Rho termination factor N-terminal domain-containing protein [Deltaproteobacteria bacterium]MBW2592087.1 Rho termination factor N-terminal domain-containing protein [Deltaproteobacteria bacterium]